MSQDARRDEEQSTQRRARILGMPYINVSIFPDKILYPDILSVPEMYQLKIVPLTSDQHNISFGVTTSTSQQTMQMLRQRFLDQRINFAIISDTSYRDYMKLYDPPKTVTYQDISLAGNDKNLYEAISQTLDQVRADDILAYLVKQTYQLKGSDIHMECQKEAVRIRVRVDGVLHSIAHLSQDKYRQVISSIAITANVSSNSTDAQTGHINKEYVMATGEKVAVNLRVETVPSVYGQDVVMRLFNFKLEYLKLENLGLNAQERKVVDDIIKHPRW